YCKYEAPLEALLRAREQQQRVPASATGGQLVYEILENRCGRAEFSCRKVIPGRLGAAFKKPAALRRRGEANRELGQLRPRCRRTSRRRPACTARTRGGPALGLPLIPP